MKSPAYIRRRIAFAFAIGGSVFFLASSLRTGSMPAVSAMTQSGSGSTQHSEPPADTPLPEGTGKDTAKRVCTKCHGSNVWVAQRHTREKWASIVDNMISKGMEASDDEIDTVTEYLAANLAPAPRDPPTPPSATPPSK